VTRPEAAPSGRLGVSVVVLAGGRSARFGSPKLEASLEGRPLITHAVELARRLSDDVVIAIPAAGAAPLLPEAVRVVRDPQPFGGPLAGLASALGAIDRSIAIVLGGDMPRLPVELVQPMLITLGQEDEADAVVLERDGVPQPLPLVVRTVAAREAAIAILDGTGERSLRALVGALRSRTIDERHWRALDPDGIALADVDRPPDLDALEDRTRR
jgi:molybdenum cofactor guanylyltransferase